MLNLLCAHFGVHRFWCLGSATRQEHLTSHSILFYSSTTGDILQNDNNLESAPLIPQNQVFKYSWRWDMSQDCYRLHQYQQGTPNNWVKISSQVKRDHNPLPIPKSAERVWLLLLLFKSIKQLLTCTRLISYPKSYSKTCSIMVSIESTAPCSPHPTATKNDYTYAYFHTCSWTGPRF